jgi:hypothetical protein
MSLFADASLDTPAGLEKLRDRMTGITTLGTRFMAAAEEFLVAAVKADGWQMKVDSAG